MNYVLEKFLSQAKAIRKERQEKYADTWLEMSTESLIDFAKAKLERYLYFNNEDDIVDTLNYIEFVLKKRGY